MFARSRPLLAPIALLVSGFLLAGCPTRPAVEDDAGTLFVPPTDGGATIADGGIAADGGANVDVDGGGQDEDAGPQDGGNDAGTPSPALAVVFVFDQDGDALYRLVDRNGDGDAMDPGEMTLFFDDTDPITGTTNSQGILTISEDEVWVTDNAAPANVVRLVDENGDGDALDDGESSILWDGTLPPLPPPSDGVDGGAFDGGAFDGGAFDGGAFDAGVAPSGSLLLPTALARGADGEVYLYDNNTLDKELGPEAIYRLNDFNADDVTTADEVDVFAILSPAGPVSTVTGFDVAVSANGRAYYVDSSADDDIHRIYSVGEGETPRVYVDGAELFSATDGVGGGPGFVLSTGRPKLEIADDGQSLLVLVGTFPDRGKVLLRMRDTDLSGKVDAAGEVAVLWSADGDQGPDMGTFGDFAHLRDGDVVACEAFSDRVVRLYDRNGDGDMNDDDEVLVLYDRALAEAASLPELSAPRFCHGALLGP